MGQHLLHSLWSSSWFGVTQMRAQSIHSIILRVMARQTLWISDLLRVRSPTNTGAQPSRRITYSDAKRSEQTGGKVGCTCLAPIVSPEGVASHAYGDGAHKHEAGKVDASAHPQCHKHEQHIAAAEYSSQERARQVPRIQKTRVRLQHSRGIQTGSGVVA